MNKKDYINPEELNVIDIFGNVEYIIPIYQRNYAWGTKEIEQLLNDIFDCNSKQKYYLGNLIVDKDKNKSNTYYVIDGQQRLTTLFLLFKYLYEKDDLENWNKIQNSLIFEARDKSNRTLKENLCILNLNEKNSNCYLSEIIDGYRIIKNYFESKKIESEKCKDEIKSKLVNVKIIRTQVPEKIDLNYYFEVMNTRGEQLELHEIAKSKIIEHLSSDEDRLIAAKIWDACSQMNTYVQMNFKPHIRKALFGCNWNEFNHKEFDDLKKIIEDLTNVCFINFINKYCIENTDNSVTKNDILDNIFEIDGDTIIKKIKEKIEEKCNNTEKENKKSEINENSLLSILSNQEKFIIKEKNNCNNQEENERFESIVSFPSFLLIVNETIKKSKGNNLNEDDATLDDKNFIETLKDNWSSPKEALDFIYSLLKYRFLFDKYIIKREFAKNYKDTGKWSLQKLEKYDAKDSPNYLGSFSDENNQKLRALQSVFRITYTSPKTMHWISKVLSEINININDDDDDKIIKILEKYACNKILQSHYDKASGFEFYRIVFTYLDYLLIRDKNKDKDKYEFKKYLKNTDIDNFEFQFRNSLEHFSPQTGGDFSNNPTVLNSFGNLALITVSGNSKFSNMTPNQKIDKKNESIVNQSPKLMIMASYCNKEKQWNEKMVENHKKEMFDILKDELKSKGIEQSNE